MIRTKRAVKYITWLQVELQVRLWWWLSDWERYKINCEYNNKMQNGRAKRSLSLSFARSYEHSDFRQSHFTVFWIVFWPRKSHLQFQQLQTCPRFCLPCFVPRLHYFSFQIPLPAELLCKCHEFSTPQMLLQNRLPVQALPWCSPVIKTPVFWAELCKWRERLIQQSGSCDHNN